MKPKQIYIGTAVIIVFILFGYYFFFFTSTTNVTQVWAIDDGEKVRQTDLSHPLENKNSIWDGQKISLFGMKNEIIGFQIIIESENASAQNVDVEFKSLNNGFNEIKNSDISEGDPYDYRGKNIELFKEQYINVLTSDVRARGLDIYGERQTGYLPDALIPFEAEKSKGGAPFNIDAGKNQGVWIDLYIPKTASALTYKGTIYIKESGKVIKQIPVELKVYDAMMPDENHFHQWFFGSADELQKNHGVKFRSTSSPGTQLFAGDFIEERYFQMAHRHRMDLTFNTNLSGMEGYYKKFITGTDYNLVNKYDGPGINQPHTTYSIGTYDLPFYGAGSGFSPDTQQGWWSAADKWVTWFKLNSPNTQIFKYMLDEPEYGKNGNGIRVTNMTANVTWNYEHIKTRSMWLDSNPGIGKELDSFVTTKLDRRLYGVVDFWSTQGWSMYYGWNHELLDPWGYNVGPAAQRRALGEKVGIYNDNRPFYPAIQYIDTEATDPTAMMWLAWKYNVDQYFLWEVNLWDAWSGTGCSYCFDKPRDVFSQVVGTSYGNGDFIYPGQQVDIVGPNDKNLEGPIASMRMKSWRRGMQDYEYLWLAKQKGISTSAIVNKIVPNAFDDFSSTFVNQNSPATWASRGSSYQDARKQILEMIKK